MIKLANVRIMEETTFDSQDYLVHRQFLEILSAKYRNYHDVSSYAEMLNITARKFSETYKRCGGMGAKEIINGQIVAEAKRLLQFSSNTGKEIGFELGYNEKPYFTTVFKRKTGQTPTAFRREIKTLIS